MVGKGMSLFYYVSVEGRQVPAAVLVANEGIDSFPESNESDALCKLDIEKAYEHINCNFLLVRKRIGFERSG